MNAAQSWGIILGVWANALAWWIYFDRKPVK